MESRYRLDYPVSITWGLKCSIGDTMGLDYPISIIPFSLSYPTLSSTKTEKVTKIV